MTLGDQIILVVPRWLGWLIVRGWVLSIITKLVGLFKGPRRDEDDDLEETFK